ncbi:MAG: glutamate 5-kinase, partial [Clostridiales bacterium]|nr:glutamate 5-kinase [Clostridiales bacterium]
DMPTKQATAAVGQCELMYIYDKLFSEYNHVVAQLLVTGEDLEHEDRCQNIQNTLFRLLELKVLPIVNENDTIATQEIAVGDNDTLSAIVAVRMKAELLVILSDIDGLYTANPKEDSGARLIPVVWELDEKIQKLAGEGCGPLGTGGMVTKLHAAALATAQGTDVVIANGQSPELLYDILDGAAVGTRFIGRRTE